MIDLLCVGHAAYDLTMSVEHHPDSDEKMQALSMQSCGGGPAANAAVQAARLGGGSSFCGYLGHDLYGDAHVAEFEEEGVNLSCLVRGKYPSPVSQILAKPDASRSLVNYKGETPWLAADAVDISRLNPRAILFDGHEPLISEKIMDWAVEHAVPTVLDAGSVHRGTETLAMRAAYLVASSKFARVFCNTSDMQVALESLAIKRDNVVITMGDQGLLWAKGGIKGRLDAFKVGTVDSTGAGDAFHGAFALGIAHGMDWDQLLRFASAAGALTCTSLVHGMDCPAAMICKSFWKNSKMQRILISACLMGENVRFDGKNSKKSSEIINKWQKDGILVILCPEVSGGLPVPRSPAEIQPDGSIITVEGRDVTAAFEQGAQQVLELCKQHDIRIAILKEGSPSCGSSLINDGNFSHVKIPGQGMTTRLLEANGIRVFNENELDQAEAYFKAIE